MPHRPAQPQNASTGLDPFDLWIRRSLHESWDATLDEKLPDDLLRLFTDDRGEWKAMKARWLKLEQIRDSG
ncbi:hypothetical protein J8J14_02425 [Roseomonas sp. SSH11]|uniref:Uncharacterized protein n=1 Tax=Pararoseomonas baculiformis TaxID=2820812 RepID=A0ABS4A9G3_9PROT|nr:hypothetical protein [Pararoseomonas baculiformis]MBP0443622.1 hypothetical protein [Pararoseomonas baculiformis]